MVDQTRKEIDKPDKMSATFLIHKGIIVSVHTDLLKSIENYEHPMIKRE